MRRPILETQRLILREFCEDDMDAIYKIFSNKKMNTFLPWFPLKTMIEAKQFFEERYACTKDYKYAICLRNENIPIGYIHISMDASHDLGYGILEDYWHQGIVSEAGRAIFKQAQSDGMPFITATHDTKNIHSGYVMKSLGMNYQYTYEELWQPKNYVVSFRMYQLNFIKKQAVYKQYWDMYPQHWIETDI